MRRVIILASLLVLCAVDASPYQYRQKITVSGTGSDETNYVLKLNVHRSSGTNSAGDVYLGGNCKTDFSDVRFTDSAGTELSYYRHSYGNYEVIPDSTRLGQFTWICSNGDLFASGVSGQAAGAYLSADNGTTWASVYAGATIMILFEDSRGYLYAQTSTAPGNGTHLVVVSKDRGENWATLVDMSAKGAYVPIRGIAEDVSHAVYIGWYQDAEKYARIDKITWADGTPSAATVYLDTTTYTHVHSIAVDPYTEYIYAHLDNALGMIRSVDNGANWTLISSDVWSSGNGTFFGDGYRLFASENGYTATIVRTIDDSTFTQVLGTGAPATSINGLGSGIYATLVTYDQHAYPSLARSTDLGLTWTTVWVGDYIGAPPPLYAGWKFVNFPDTPAGTTEQQLALGAIGTGQVNARLFDGGDHYQGLFFVKIPSLSAAGGEIYIHYGNSVASTASSLTGVFGGLTQGNLVAHWKLDEGTGTNIADSSGNNWTGVLTLGTGSWPGVQGRAAGAQRSIGSGNSLLLNGDGAVDITGSGTGITMVNNLSYVAWVKPVDSTSSLRTILGKNSANYKMGFSYRANGSILFYYGDGSTVRSVIATGIHAAIQDQSWHMIAVTLDSADPPNAKFYFDGIPSPTTYALNNTPASSTGNYRIGNFTSDFGAMVGYVDDVQIYNTQLSDAQMRQIYEDRVFVGASEASGMGSDGLHLYTPSGGRSAIVKGTVSKGIFN